MQTESNKTSPRIRLITALIGLSIVATFVFGLAYSIATGFAGLEGGLPFIIITSFVMLLAAYDIWVECIRKDKK